jgi:hypothetical protein
VSQRVDLGPSAAAAAKAIETWCCEDHEEPSQLVHAVIVIEMQTLSGERWLHRCGVTGTDGFHDMPPWVRDGMLQHAIAGFDDSPDEDDES